jgi:hypothetical protein
VTFPASLLDQMARLVPPRERNSFVVAATAKALQAARLRAAIASLEQQPAWSENDHPGLASDEDVDRYVRSLRESWTASTWEALAGEGGADAGVSA